jgi:putative FmdB family regulatory protein
MPIYEYQCQSCGKEMEVLQKISDEPLLECPECGQPSLKKKVTAAAFRLKGGGWYETDFKTSNKKNLHGGGGDTAASGSTTSSGAGDKSGSSTAAADKPTPASSK